MGKTKKKKNTTDYSYMNEPIGGGVQEKPKSILLKEAKDRVKAIEEAMGLKYPESAGGSLPLGEGGKKKKKKKKKVMRVT
ncbi:MAG: hypothetical protein CMB80_28675 [Flammeovirgaceae bacterium]|jgi:hypothetical protein|nr:hypothetical protein [Flammeovirgaceae bacterium]|tara:strand:- start:4561 stop:4800 length:240 start_codon:yes stop_codon:yes gene_type:complete